MSHGDKISIHIVPQVRTQADTQRQYAEAVAYLRVQEHRRGEHTYGNMRRDCPLRTRSSD